MSVRGVTAARLSGSLMSEHTGTLANEIIHPDDIPVRFSGAFGEITHRYGHLYTSRYRRDWNQ